MHMHINLSCGKWIKIARTLATSNRLSICWASESTIEEMGAQAWTDGQRIYLRAPDPAWNDEQYKLWLYYLLHEIGHNTKVRRGVFHVLKDKRPGPLLAFVYNILEDHILEAELSSEYPVLRGHMSRGRAAYYEFIIGQRRNPGHEQRLLDDVRAPVMFNWDAELRPAFQPDTLGYHARLSSVLSGHAEAAEYTSKLRAGSYAAEIAAYPDPYQSFKLAERIAVEVFGDLPECKCEPQPTEGEKQDGQGNAGNGDGSAGSEASTGDNNGQAEPGTPGTDGNTGAAAGGGKPEPGDGKGTGSGGKFDYRDLMMHEHQCDKRAGGEPKQVTGRGITIDYDAYFSSGQRGRTFRADLEGLHVYDLAKGQYPGWVNNGPAAEPSALSRKVARYIQAETMNRKLHGQKQGKLSGRSLYRLKVKGSGEARKRVFHKRIINHDRDVAVSLGLDCSGSMKGDKTAAAISAVTHLHEVLSVSLRIPLEIVGFTEKYRTGVHMVFQSFGNARPNGDIERDLRRVLPASGGNRDGEYLLWARERLLKQRAERRILLVLSDGQPYTGNGADVAGFTSDVCTAIEKDRSIELYAIGILSSSVRHFYQHSEVLTNVAELETRLINVLKDKILNRN